MKKGEAEIAGVTDREVANRLFYKRATKLRKAFALDKKDDVRRYVVRREIKRGDKTFFKSPKIQRLVTEKRIRRKKVIKASKKTRWEMSKKAKESYEKILSTYAKERKAKAVAERKVTAPAVVKK